MQINWRKWNRIFHRDLGYIFFGMTLIYALSGLALNHMADWNPNYVITHKTVRWEKPVKSAQIDKELVLEFLEQLGFQDEYKKHYFPAFNRLKIFLKNGSVDVDLKTGNGIIEVLKKRALFYEVNFLHYNPKRLWTWFSDLYCVALIVIAITGLFIIRGKKGITGRGAWLTGLGLLLPLLFLIFYL